MPGEAVSRVLTSNHPGYAEGDIVVALTGWRTRALSDGVALYGLNKVVRGRCDACKIKRPPHAWI
jgi:NADPH-dependent curcumin reductase CurA